MKKLSRAEFIKKNRYACEKCKEGDTSKCICNHINQYVEKGYPTRQYNETTFKYRGEDGFDHLIQFDSLLQNWENPVIAYGIHVNDNGEIDIHGENFANESNTGPQNEEDHTQALIDKSKDAFVDMFTHIFNDAINSISVKTNREQIDEPIKEYVVKPSREPQQVDFTNIGSLELISPTGDELTFGHGRTWLEKNKYSIILDKGVLDNGKDILKIFIDYTGNELPKSTLSFDRFEIINHTYTDSDYEPSVKFTFTPHIVEVERIVDYDLDIQDGGHTLKLFLMNKKENENE